LIYSPPFDIIQPAENYQSGGFNNLNLAGVTIMNKIVFLMAVCFLLFGLGCSNAPTSPDYGQQLAEVPSLTGIVGTYTFTANDGSVETGSIIRGEDGSLSMSSDREASVIANAWFNIDIEYLNPRSWWQGKYPVYRRGDTIQYRLDIQYNRQVPLNLYPLLYSKLTTEQRHFNIVNGTPAGLLPGDSVEVWDPFEVAPMGFVQVFDDYLIPADAYFSWGCTTVGIDMQFLGGLFQMNMITGLLGIWDP
jgi:hypothetical protein